MSSSYVFTDVSMHEHIFTHTTDFKLSYQSSSQSRTPRFTTRVFTQTTLPPRKPQVPEERPLKAGAAAGFSVKFT